MDFLPASIFRRFSVILILVNLMRIMQIGFIAGLLDRDGLRNGRLQAGSFCSGRLQPGTLQIRKPAVLKGAAMKTFALLAPLKVA